MNKKTIRLFCIGPLGVSAKYHSPWEDIWIECDLGMKKKFKDGSCVIGLIDLENEIRFEYRMIDNCPDHDRDTLDQCLKIKKEFDSGVKFAILDETFQEECPNLFVNNDFIDRKLSEEVITWYLEKRGILKTTPRYKWKKYSQFRDLKIS